MTKNELRESAMTKEDHPTIDHDAPPPSSLRRITPFMWRFIAAICAIAWIANFDYGFSGIVLAMPSFNQAFGSVCTTQLDAVSGVATEVCKLSSLQQSLLSVSALFQALGAALSGVTGTFVGRRGTVMIGAAFVAVGAAGMLGTSQSYLNYMVCKCINAAGTGQLFVVGITYGTESAPPDQRGLLMGIYNVALTVGNAIAAGVCAGSARLSPTNDWQWRVPIACQIPLSVLLVATFMFFPDSPRWLIVRGKDDDARVALAKFFDLDQHSEAVTAQMDIIAAGIEAETYSKSSSAWISIYRPPNLRRTLVSAFMLVTLQITGIQFVAPYTALFLSSLGVASAFTTHAIVSVCIFAGSLVSPWILDHVGRRLSLLYGYAIAAGSMLIFSAVGSALGTGSTITQRVLVAFLCVWAFVFGGAISASSWLTSAEVHAVHLRTQGQANTQAFASIFSFAAQFWTPYMIVAIGTSVGYFYAGVTIVTLTIAIFIVPETSRLTLEQIDTLFTSGTPAWRTTIAGNKQMNLARGP
jgi:sugar porter (SP) family MFS transporter